MIRSSNLISALQYCKFTLCKEGKDTNEAITVLSKLLTKKRSVFSFAGSKDKRGVTTQVRMLLVLLVLLVLLMLLVLVLLLLLHVPQLEPRLLVLTPQRRP